MDRVDQPGEHTDHRQSDQPGDQSRADGGCGIWTEAFERLHRAATSDAPTAEVERLAAAELDDLTRWIR